MRLFIDILYFLWHLLVVVWQLNFLIFAKNESLNWAEKFTSLLIIILFVLLFFLELKKKIKKQNVIVIEIVFIIISILFASYFKLQGFSFG